MSRDSGESVADTVLQAVTLSLILAVGVVLNAVVLGVFCSSRSLRSTRHSMFVINLIFCDVIFLLSVMPLSLVDVVCPDVCVSVLREGMLCQVTGFLTMFQCILAALTLAVIAVDRYLAVVWITRHRCIDSRTATYVTLLVIWVISALGASPPFVFPDDATFVYEAGTKHCSPSLKTDCWLFGMAVFFGLGSTIPTMTFCYCRIVLEVRGQRRKVQTSVRVLTSKASAGEETSVCTKPCSEGELGQSAGKIKSETRSRPSTKRLEQELAKRGAVMILAYLCCWSLYTVTHACPVRLEGPLWLEVTAMWIVFTLTIWNPIIYVFNNRQFIEELNRLTRRHKH